MDTTKIRKASAQWKGDLKSGTGLFRIDSIAFEAKFSAASRFEESDGTNPEELIGAAHAGCFSMALSANLDKNGFKPENISTQANVSLVKTKLGFTITRIDLYTEVRCAGIENQKFQEIAAEAKKNCPVSRALASIEIGLEAKLL